MSHESGQRRIAAFERYSLPSDFEDSIDFISGLHLPVSTPVPRRALKDRLKHKKVERAVVSPIGKNGRKLLGGYVDKKSALWEQGFDYVESGDDLEVEE